MRLQILASAVSVSGAHVIDVPRAPLEVIHGEGLDAGTVVLEVGGATLFVSDAAALAGLLTVPTA